jgi:hypothetical protein
MSAPRVTPARSRPSLAGARRRLVSLKDRLDSERQVSAVEPAVRPIPKYVPLNPHVPGTIALAFFTHRGFCRP